MNTPKSYRKRIKLIASIDALTRGLSDLGLKSCSFSYYPIHPTNITITGKITVVGISRYHIAEFLTRMDK